MVLATSPPEAPPAPCRTQPLALANLLLDLEALCGHLERQIAVHSWLNAYLLAAGMTQVVEDHLYRDRASLRRLSRRLSAAPSPIGRIGAGAVRRAASVTWRVTRERPGGRVPSALAELGVLTAQLAGAVVGPTGAVTAEEAGAMQDRAWAAHRRVALLPHAARRSVVRLPSCFRSFDQRPADLEQLAAGFAGRWPDRSRPIAVVGVRTSGSHLAPLVAALLRALGYPHVHVATVRPIDGWLGGDEHPLHRVLDGDGLVVLCDDPPQSGATLAATAGELERRGWPQRSIVLLLQLFGTNAELPDALRSYPAVLLPWARWAVHHDLDPSVVAVTVSGLLGPDTTVRQAERLSLEPAAPRRGHVSAVYRLELHEAETGAARTQIVHVRGVGLGYLGEHTLAVAAALEGRVPALLGLARGLVYEEWLPPERRLSAQPAGISSAVDATARYTVARARALPVAEDVALRLHNRHAAWQQAADLLGRAFGRGALLARPGLHRTSRRLLRVSRPSVIDGDMDLRHWFLGEDGGRTPLKVAADARAFSNCESACFDPVFDVAGAAAAHDGRDLGGLLRERYQELAGEHVGDERWLLYQLIHLQARLETPGVDQPAVERAVARCRDDYYVRTHFGGLPPTSAGDLCAIDIDGVLENGGLGWWAMTPAAALGLRALVCHGYRPVPVTGRSLPEVRERCQAYSLAGGVAEYGAAVHERAAARDHVLLNREEVAALEEVRSLLAGVGGVHVDSAHRHSVRAYRRDSAGHRRGLTAEMTAEILLRSGTADLLRPVAGWAQTDFTARRLDKGVALRELVLRLAGEEHDGGRMQVAFAIGDTQTDLPMMAQARIACAPSNCDAAVVASGVRVLRHHHQHGLVEGVALLLGHRPGGCERCRMPSLSAEARLVLTALRAADAGRWGKLGLALALTARSLRP